MSDDSNMDAETSGKSGGDGSRDDRDEAVELLMSIAGQRTAIPTDVESRVRASVEREWRDATYSRRTLRWSVPLALAASVLLAWTFLVREPAPGPVAVGTVARVAGVAGELAAGQRLFAGDRLQAAADGGVSVELSDSTSLRLAAGSVLDLDDTRAFTLVAGQVYVDTGEAVYRAAPVSVATPLGTVTDVGTQFVVGLGGAEVRVAVREGEVSIATDGQPMAAAAGERIILDADAGPVTEYISATDPEWEWATALAPPFDLEGKSVLDFLKWVARETGLELEFLLEDDRRAAMAAEMHGTIDGMTPMEALVSVMPTTRFNYVIDGDAISVTR